MRFEPSSITSASELSERIARETESVLLAQLNDFISRGLIVIEHGPVTFVRDFGSSSVRYSRQVSLRLKDREYIERLEKEVEDLRRWKSELAKAVANDGGRSES